MSQRPSASLESPKWIEYIDCIDHLLASHDLALKGLLRHSPALQEQALAHAASEKPWAAYSNRFS